MSPRTATALAHPNIALVKYWGKRDVALNLPAVPSLSLTLDGFATTTTVRWGAVLEEVEVGLQGFWLKTLRLDLLDKNVEAVLTLSTGGDLGTAPDQVVAVGQRWVVCVTHVIERAHC